MTRVARIRFPATWADVSEGYPIAKSAVADFSLGKGPCGREVVGLAFEVSGGALTIHQAHSEGSDKAFVYPLDQIRGRIEVHYP